MEQCASASVMTGEANCLLSLIYTVTCIYLISLSYLIIHLIYLSLHLLLDLSSSNPSRWWQMPSTECTATTSEEFPPFRTPSPKKECTATPSPINPLSHEQILRAMSNEIHQHADISSFSSKERPIVVEDTNKENTPPPLCTRCGEIGHQWEDCDASLKFRGICETCLWERRHGDCPHFHFPSPAFVKRTKAAVAERNQRERQV